MAVDSKKDLEDKIYPNFARKFNDPTYLMERAIMSTSNEIVQQCNFDLIQKMPGEPMISYSIDECIDDDDKAKFDEDTLNKINASGMPPHRLVLKKGACIILIRNLSIRDGHCNGTRYIILDLKPNVIRATKLQGGTNAEILIPRIPIFSKDGDFVAPFKRIQFPVLGAYYLTLNRAQGQTLKHAGMYLPQSVFSHGHFYVGNSRCGDPDNMAIYADQEEFKDVRHLIPSGVKVTRNVVYNELFQGNTILD